MFARGRGRQNYKHRGKKAPAEAPFSLVRRSGFVVRSAGFRRRRAKTVAPQQGAAAWHATSLQQ